jgi:predicted Zn-dependent protease
MDNALSFSPKNISLLLQKSFILSNLPHGSKDVVRILEPLVSTHGHYDALWHWLGKAYATMGHTGRMEMCLAERYSIMQKWSQAEFHIRRAQKLLPQNDPYHQRSKDLLHHIKKCKK